MEDTEQKVFQGTVIFFTRGFGFLQSEDGAADRFVHYSDIIAPEGTFKTLKKGQRVSYELGLNQRGQVKAVKVTPISE